MMTEDDDSDDLEGDLELNEFVDKIKCLQSKSGIFWNFSNLLIAFLSQENP